MRSVVVEDLSVKGTGAGSSPGLYLHVPFCATTCDFCAFYQERPGAGDMERYVEGIAREMELVDWPGAPGTIFWGGGTPGLLPPEQIRRLGEIFRRGGSWGAPREWSVEMTPAAATSARLKALREIGVTRISLGAQSFQPELLEALGRQHPREAIFSAYGRIRDAGFASVNIDLMFALPGQIEEEWMLDLETALSLDPDHLSTYCLTFEEDTALYVKLGQGKVSIDVDKEALFYRRTWNRLEEAGFRQYEVSNFCRPGHECRHNINTWRMGEWVGLGPAAASQFGGWRSSNVADTREWLIEVEGGARSTRERARLAPALLAADSLIFGLRMNEGVDLGEWRKRFPAGVPEELESWMEEAIGHGLLARSGEWIAMTTEGRLVADRIGFEIFDRLG